MNNCPSYVSFGYCLGIVQLSEIKPRTVPLSWAIASMSILQLQFKMNALDNAGNINLYTLGLHFNGFKSHNE